jgi:lipooligosaccharide transport system permease protein
MSFVPDLWLRGAGHVWMRNLVVYRKTWLTNILPNFFEPVIYLLAMGVGLGAYLREGMGGVSYLAFISPGLIAASAMNGASFETTYNVFVKMHFGRTYHAITATPVNIEDAMFGEILWAMTRGIVYGGAFALVVGLFGLLTWTAGLLLVPVIVLSAFLFATVGLAFTSFIRVIDAYSFYYTLFLTPMFLFSGIFFPVADLPGWAQVTAWFFPLTHCVTLARGAVQGGLTAAGAAGEVAWVTIAGIGLCLLSIHRIRSRYVGPGTGTASMGI